MKRVIILGATGSIGTTALDSIRTLHLPLEVVGLTAHSHVAGLEALGKEFHARTLLIRNEDFSGLRQLLEEVPCDIVLNGISGFSGLSASVCVLEKGIDLALANKESVVCGSSFLFDLARKHHASIIPVDSEHSAIYELLKEQRKDEVASLLITASGGPFRSREDLSGVTVEEALHHPTWKMGPKITIDSATLANKAFEVLEAHGLFGFEGKRIEVVVHPQSIVHSMIRMHSGAVYAQLGNPNMSLPIISALLPGTTAPLVKPLDFTKLTLSFEAPDLKRFPLLGLAWKVLERGDCSALSFVAADEVAVDAFLHHRLPFTGIGALVEQVVEESKGDAPADISEALRLDATARAKARTLLCSRTF